MPSLNLIDLACDGLSSLLGFRISVGQMLLKSLIAVSLQQHICTSNRLWGWWWRPCLMHCPLCNDRGEQKISKTLLCCSLLYSAECRLWSKVTHAQGNSKVISLAWLHWTSCTCILMPCSASFLSQILYALCKGAFHVLCKISCWQNSFAIRKYCIAWAG